MYCTKCGKEFHESDDFCGGCGAKVQAEPGLCAGCGSVLREGNAFCSGCGTKASATADNQENWQAESSVPQQTIEQHATSPQKPAAQQYRRTSPATAKRKKPRSNRGIVATFCIVVVVAIAVGLFFVLQRDSQEYPQGNSPAAVFANDDANILHHQSDEPIITAISAGGSHTVALRADGRVLSTALTDYAVGSWTDVIAVAAGTFHTVGLRADGSVIFSGWVDGFTNIEEWTDVVAIGRYSAIRADGSVICFIQGNRDLNEVADIVYISSNFGLRADGTVVSLRGWDDSEHFTQFVYWTDIIAISDGPYHIVGLRADGAVVADGISYIFPRFEDGDREVYSNKLGVSGWSDIVEVSAGRYHTVGLRSDGTVVAVGLNYVYGSWDRFFTGKIDVDEWTDIIAISAGDGHTVGLKENGTIVSVGANTQGQTNVGNWKNITELSAGNNNTVGLRDDGTVVITGGYRFGHVPERSLIDVSNWTNIISATAWGEFFVFGLRADGTVIITPESTALYNDHLEFDLLQPIWESLSSWTEIVAIASGSYHLAGLRADGTVVVFDFDGDSFGVDDWTDIIAISAGGSYSTVGLKSDGTVVAFGQWWGIPEPDVSDWYDIIAISAGETHIVGLRADGTVVAAGYYYGSPYRVREIFGEFGRIEFDEDYIVLFEPQYYFGRLDVGNWTDIIAISAGRSHTVGLRSDGTVVAAGYNYHHGERIGLLDVEGWTNIIAISAGYNHTVGLRADGSIVATGHASGLAWITGWGELEATPVQPVGDSGVEGSYASTVDEPEVALSNAEIAEAFLQVLHSYGSPQANHWGTVMDGVISVSVVDLNNDGIPELVLSRVDGDEIYYTQGMYDLVTRKYDVKVYGFVSNELVQMASIEYLAYSHRGGQFEIFSLQGGGFYARSVDGDGIGWSTLHVVYNSFDLPRVVLRDRHTEDWDREYDSSMVSYFYIDNITVSEEEYNNELSVIISERLYLLGASMWMAPSEDVVDISMTFDEAIVYLTTWLHS